MSGQALCGAKTRQDGTCRQVSGFGTDHVGFGRCKFHGGASPNGRTMAAKEAANAEVARLGMAVDTDPGEALLHVVALDSAELTYLRHKVQDLEEDEALKNGAMHPTVRAFRDSRDTLARHSKLALDAGIEERRLRLVENTAERVATVMSLVVDELDLTPMQQGQFREAMARHLPLLDSIEKRALESAA